MSATRRSRTHSPSVLLTALPGLLGFIPERSLVVLGFGDRPGHVQVTARHDLVVDTEGALVPEILHVLDEVDAMCVREGVRGVVVVFADDRFPITDPRYRQMFASVDDHLTGSGGLAAGFVVPDFVAGGRWRTVWEGRQDLPRAVIAVSRSAPTQGHLDDPNTCATAIDRMVQTGKPVLARRSDMTAMLTTLDHCAGPHAAPRDHPPATDDAGLLRMIVEHVTRTAPPGDLDCRTVTLMGEALTRMPVRDAAFTLACTAFRGPTERLWRELARRLRGTQRASAATMLAHLHYATGEGAYAGVALDHALAADPHWNMAQLLDTALRSGLPPRELGLVIDCGYRAAERLGVHIPQPLSESTAG